MTEFTHDEPITDDIPDVLMSIQEREAFFQRFTVLHSRLETVLQNAQQQQQQQPSPTNNNNHNNNHNTSTNNDMEIDGDIDGDTPDLKIFSISAIDIKKDNIINENDTVIQNGGKKSNTIIFGSLAVIFIFLILAAVASYKYVQNIYKASTPDLKIFATTTESGLSCSSIDDTTDTLRNIYTIPSNFYSTADDIKKPGPGRFNEDDKSLEAIDSLDTFAEKLNAHWGQSIFSQEYIDRLNDEDVDYAGFQAMVIDYKQRGVLLLTDKNGEYKMKGGHVLKMYDFVVKQQSQIGKNVDGSISAIGAFGIIKSKSQHVSGGSSGIPFIGDKYSPPDYIGMIGYIYEPKLLSKDIKPLLKAKTYFNSRGRYWLRNCNMIKQHKIFKKQNPNKNISASKLTELSSEALGHLKWISICVLNSPPKMEEIFEKHSKHMTGKQSMDDIRNFLGDVYMEHKEDLHGVQYAFGAQFVQDFQLMWGGDIWDAVKNWVDTSTEYLEHTLTI